MKRILLLTIILSNFIFNASGQALVAFPGAEGFGMYAKGGRGGKILFVTNLNDKGPGSFREAVMNPNPRIVIFTVSGTITLKSALEITSPYLTIAGQTAPGDGICIKGWPFHIANTHDIIVRNIRIRLGTESKLKGSEIDGVEVRNSENVIFDHCTVSWSCDEGMNNWHQCKYITFQWCMICEPLNKSVHEKGAHGFGASVGGYKASFHHNIIAHATARNPSIAGNADNRTEFFDMRNNVIYNWMHRSCDGKPSSINIINNYYKPGPATLEDLKRRIAKIDNSERMGFVGKWYIEGNYVDGFPAISEDNWNGGIDYEEGSSAERNRSHEMFDVFPVSTQTAQDAYKLVLDNGGVIAPKRDKHEERIVDEIKNGIFHFGNKDIVDNPQQVGGWPLLKGARRSTDTDKDGIPDIWEAGHGLNPEDPSDATAINEETGYSHVEEYINALVPDPYLHF